MVCAETCPGEGLGPSLQVWTPPFTGREEQQGSRPSLPSWWHWSSLQCPLAGPLLHLP